MSHFAIRTDGAPAAVGPYEQAVKAGPWVFCSGQIGLDPQTGEMVSPDDVVAQTRRIMDNLVEVLRSAGSGLSQVVKTTIYLVDIRDFARVNEVYGSYLGDCRPARATVAVAALPKGAKVEIDAVAMAHD